MHEPASSSRQKVNEEVSSMLRDGSIDGIVQLLERKYGGQWGQLAEDAVSAAIVRVLAAAEQREIRHVRAVLFRAAENVLLRSIRREGIFGEEPDDEPAEFSEELDLVDARRTVALLKRKMADWTDSVRVITGLVLDAVVENIDLSSDELAQEATQILGRTVTADEARAWKSRGLKKLRENLNPAEWE